jgi:hypothetical protein
VLLNSSPSVMTFMARTIAKEARILRIRELGKAKQIELSGPLGLEISSLLPKATIYLRPEDSPASRSGRIAQLLEGLHSARMLLVDLPTAADSVQSVAEAFRPDIVWLSADNHHALHATGSDDFALDTYRPKIESQGFGLERARIRANATGVRALDAALHALAVEAQRRRGQKKIVYDVNKLIFGAGMYKIERDDFYSWAWTGPGTTARVAIPAPPTPRFRVTLFFFAAMLPIAPEFIEAWIGDAKAPARYFQDEQKIEFELFESGAAPCVWIEIRQARTVPTEDHSRRIGYALHKVMVELSP